MKIYSVIGTEIEVIDESSKPQYPAGHIEMQLRRPEGDYLARADGTWVLAQGTHEAVCEAIKALRSEKRAGGIPLKLDGKTRWFNSDEASRVQQLALAAKGDNLPEGLQWKTLANDFVTMTPVLASGLVDAAFAQDALIFAAAEKHLAAMRALPDPAVYDFTGGWPMTYADWAGSAAALAEEAAAREAALPDVAGQAQMAAVVSVSTEPEAARKAGKTAETARGGVFAAFRQFF